MRITQRYITGVIAAAALPSALIGILGIALMQRTATTLVDDSTRALMDSARNQVAETVDANAQKLESCLNAYHHDVQALQEQVTLSIDRFPELDSSYLCELYPDKDRAGLPGYGYVNEKYGAYANWEHRGYDGTAWIRRGVVERARGDAAFREELSVLMRKIMPIVPAFMGIYGTRSDSCELLWVVTNMGFDCSYPVDYERYLVKNPGMNELDESQESYVLDFGPERNPDRAIGWTRPYIDYIKQSWMISCIAPLYDRGEYIGALGIDILLDSLTQWLQAMKVGKAGYAFLVSAEGTPLALPEAGLADWCWNERQKASLRAAPANRDAAGGGLRDSDADRWSLRDNPDPRIRTAMDRMLQGGERTLTVQLSGEEKLVAAAPIGETGWKLGIVLPVAEVAAPMNGLRSRLTETFRRGMALFLAAAAAIGLAAAAVASYLGYRTTDPIRRLVRSIDEVGRGGDWHEVDSGTRDELQMLADSVNRMVRAILENEGRFRAIFDGANDAIFILDAESGRILEVNRRMRETFGCSMEEARRLDMAAISPDPPPYSPAEILHWIAAARQGENPVFEWRSRDGQGRPLWFEANMRQADIAGRSSIIVVARDIEERVKAKAALHAEKERLSVTLQSIGDAVIATDRMGSVLLMNRVAEHMTGWCIREAEGRALSEVFRVVDERTREPREDPVAKVLASGRNVGLANHTVLIGRDGAESQIADSGAPIRDSEGRILGVVLVFRDVTRESRLSQEIQQMAKLDSLSVMAGGIAHDFNNLLSVVAGNVELSQSVIHGKDHEEALAYLANAEKAAFRARSLSLQLLTFAKGCAPIRSIIEVPPLVRESVSFALTGSKCRCSLEENGWVWPIHADASQMNQVLNNLLLNAQQAMPEGGQIDVRMENVTLDPDSSIPLPAGPYVHLEIRDNGTGIPAGILDRIFDPFFTTKKNGNGLGLASVYSIVRNHDGHVGVRSTLGQGSAFFIYLPARPDAVIRREEADATGRPVVPWNILVLDDERMISELVRKTLEKAGHRVTTVAEGKEAVGLWQRAMEQGHPYDMAILDLTVPGGLGGRDVIEGIRRIDPVARAIASSGYATDPVMDRYAEFGFAGRISKPFHIKELLDIVGSLQQSGPVLTPDPLPEGTVRPH